MTDKNKKENTVICILGMHRSGTSMVTRLLNLSGLYIDEEQNLFPAGIHNKKGYWEHKEMLAINEDILEIFGGSWQKAPQFLKKWQNDSRLDDLYIRAQKFVDMMNDKSKLWGFKDPRTCLMLHKCCLIMASMLCQRLYLHIKKCVILRGNYVKIL